MKISKFDLPNSRTQSFLTTKYICDENKVLITDILIDHNASLVATMPGSELVIKFIKARSWHEYLKLLWNHSRITKEVKGAELLSNLGLRVPKIYEVGYGVLPSSQYTYIGYYIMENLSLSGSQELSKLIRNNEITLSKRKKIMLSIYSALQAMRDHNIVFSDFHLDNVFSDNNGEITWIDTGVTTYNSLNNKKFRSKFNHSINRYINYEYSGQRLLSQAEQGMFRNLLFTSTHN